MRVYAMVHEEDGQFGISFPDFPGCYSCGDTLEETKINGLNALALHCDVMRDLNKPVCSKPMSYDEIIEAIEHDIPADTTIITLEIKPAHEAA